jgi:hypothetical protein
MAHLEIVAVIGIGAVGCLLIIGAHYWQEWRRRQDGRPMTAEEKQAIDVAIAKYRKALTGRIDSDISKYRLAAKGAPGSPANKPDTWADSQPHDIRKDIEVANFYIILGDRDAAHAYWDGLERIKVPFARRTLHRAARQLISYGISPSRALNALSLLVEYAEGSEARFSCLVNIWASSEADGDRERWALIHTSVGYLTRFHPPHRHLPVSGEVEVPSVTIRTNWVLYPRSGGSPRGISHAEKGYILAEHARIYGDPCKCDFCQTFRLG